VSAALHYRRHPVYRLDPLKDSRHREARAARELIDWLADLELRSYAARTRDSYERTIAVLLRAYPDKTMADFTDGDINHVLLTFPERSRHVNRSAFEGWFKWARKTRRITSNPMELVSMIKYRPSRAYDVFTDAEVDALCALPAPDGQLMTLLFWTGIRRQEARFLTGKRLDFDRRQLIIIEGAKGSKDRAVPMLPLVETACAELQTLEGIGRDDFLWYDRPGGRARSVRRTQPIANMSFQRWWERSLLAADVRYRKPHMSRHTFATRMRGRLAAEDVQRLLGHESVKTTLDIYVHAEHSEVAERMREAFA
jgi:integrase